MTADIVLGYAIDLALGILILALVLVSLRVIRGPTLADRVLALDQMAVTSIGFIALIAVKSGFSLYVDIALALGLVGFLATAAFARYLHVTAGRSEDSPAASTGDGEAVGGKEQG